MEVSNFFFLLLSLYVRTCPDVAVMQSKAACELKVEEEIYSKNNVTHSQSYLNVFHGLVHSNFQEPQEQHGLNCCVRVIPGIALLPYSS